MSFSENDPRDPPEGTSGDDLAAEGAGSTGPDTEAAAEDTREDPPDSDDSSEGEEDTSEGYEEEEFDEDNPYGIPPYQGDEEAPPLPEGILRRQAWLTFLLPFIIYMLVGSLEPYHPKVFEEKKKDSEAVGQPFWTLNPIEYNDYPYVYTAKIVLTVAAMLFVLSGYRTFSFHINWLGPVIGAVGAVAWIGICELDLDAAMYDFLGMQDIKKMGARPAFNPMAQIKDNPLWTYGFLAIRFSGLVLIVPIIEEFFLRGFVLRYIMDMDWWWKVPFAKVHTIAIIAGTAVPMMMHPGELLASVVWFSGITWLMLRTKNIWDCIIAHAITNLLLGLYVVYTGHWYLM